MSKSIFILGANGFIGNALTKRLNEEKKFKIYGIDINNNNLINLIGKKNFIFKKTQRISFK